MKVTLQKLEEAFNKGVNTKEGIKNIIKCLIDNAPDKDTLNIIINNGISRNDTMINMALYIRDYILGKEVLNADHVNKSKCKINSDGYKEWRLNDKYHREDGPAVECADGDKEWYLNGKQYSSRAYKKELKNVIEAATKYNSNDAACELEDLRERYEMMSKKYHEYYNKCSNIMDILKSTIDKHK